MMNCFCANHPSVKAETAITLKDKPCAYAGAAGGECYEMLFLCLPCTIEYRAANATQYKSKREAWENDLNMERDSQRARYGTSDWDDNINRDLQKGRTWK